MFMAAAARGLLVAALTLTASSATAQIGSGTITGRIIDAQGRTAPDALVKATHTGTGFVRSDVSDATGLYRLAGLPIGTYDLVITRPGFTSIEQQGITVHIAQTIALDVTLPVGTVQATVTVSAEAPLISTRSSALGEVVSLTRIQGLPLNGRQLANLAALVPGVGLGFHSDPSKHGQYAPQIGGGNGRNLNYTVDGGDNNDDTVGGLLQQFPLEAIEEFVVLTQRFDAAEGRSSGGVMSIVTKSGTNQIRGSGFGLFRNEALNAQTFSERVNQVGKQDYARYQYGGSVGGPVARDRAHYFMAYEGTQQDRTQVVNTLGVYPEQDGLHTVPYREQLFAGRFTATPAPAHHLSVRYAREGNAQQSGAGLQFAPSSWATSRNTYHSLNIGHHWVIRGAALHEAIVQYATFANDLAAVTIGPSLIFPNGVRGGSSLAAPQQTEQTKWQIRNDVSWMTNRLGGIVHELKTGVSWTHEPRLYARTGQGENGIFTMVTTDPAGPVASVLEIGGSTAANIPIDLVGLYVQDNWRVTPHLTLNLGLRWDYVSGMPIDQTHSANFQALQDAGRTGRFAGTLLEDFGHAPQRDLGQLQPRLGAVFDVRRDGRHVIRGGWGRYTDFAYTNANALTAAFDAAGGAGIVFSATNATGLRKPDGTLFRVGDPLCDIKALNTVPPGTAPRSGEVVSPRLRQPHTRQASAGWAHQLNPATAISADYVRVDGRNLNMRVRPNVRIDGVRYLAGVPILPQDINFRVALSRGRSRYDALIVGLRRRLTAGFDLSGSYTAARATSDVGTAYDEIAGNLIQDIRDPFGPVQQGPSSRTDSRHQVSVGAIVQAPLGIAVAPVFFYRSALPVHTWEGLDLNGDTALNDRTAMAYHYTGITATGAGVWEEIGPCETVNCSRRAPFSQTNVRVSRAFRLAGSTRLEALAEVFNLFNAKNPSLALTQRRLLGNGRPNPDFMRPNSFAGDIGQPEQRIGQLGLRLSF